MTPHLQRQIVTLLATLVAMIFLLRQCRKPGWGVGTLYLRVMNLRHAGVTTWGLGHVSIEAGFTILDVGCGGGKTVSRLAMMSGTGTVQGIDYSAESVAVARRTNASLIRSGRVDIRQGSVSTLPWPDGTFDLVTAVETHYYWPDLVADLREILRVLKPGGRLGLIAETYRGERFGWALAPVMRMLKARYLSLQEHRDLLASAGFAEALVFNEPRKGWVCCVGRKAQVASPDPTR